MKTITTLLLILTVLLGCETDQEEYIIQHTNTLLNVYADVTQIEADGKSTLMVSALIPADADKKTIEFITSHGSFPDSSSKKIISEAKFKNDTLIATAKLTSSLEVTDNVNIKVSVAGIEKSLSVSFKQALPDSISVESSTAAIKAGYGSEVPLQAFLIRRSGTPSLHQTVGFTGIKENDSRIGEFRAIDQSGSNNNGIVNAIFVLKDTSYTGIVRIIGSAQGKPGIISDTLNILVTK